MARLVDTWSRVRLTPADWERVAALADRETRTVSQMLGVLVAEALAARERTSITRPERAQKGAK